VDRRAFIAVIGGSLLAAPRVAEAQSAENVPRIGVLAGGSASSDSARIEAFREGLRDLGYVEGKNIVLEFRYADGNPDRLMELAASLARLKVAVIVAAGPSATRSAKEATTTIPIVMAQVNDPIDAGFVTSLARPGGTITGLSTMFPEITGKQVELLRQVVPDSRAWRSLGLQPNPAIHRCCERRNSPQSRYGCSFNIPLS